MCRQDWTYIYWMCNDIKDKSFVLTPERGCGGCGEVTADSFFPANRILPSPCPECVESQKWISMDGIWMPRDLAESRGWKPPP